MKHEAIVSFKAIEIGNIFNVGWEGGRLPSVARRLATLGYGYDSPLGKACGIGGSSDRYSGRFAFAQWNAEFVSTIYSEGRLESRVYAVPGVALHVAASILLSKRLKPGLRTRL